MRRNSFGAAGVEKLSDAELSEQLGRYQRQARTSLRVGLLGIASGLIAAVAMQNTALKAVIVAVLFGGGLCCVLFLSSGAQKKLKLLMQEQLGNFFREELEKTFGPALHTLEMQIDRQLLETLCLPEGKWEECETESFREGSYHGLHFAAANVHLYHVYEQGHGKGSLGTSRDLVFKGLVLRCETCSPVPSAIRATARTESSPCGVMTGDELFDRCFFVTAEREQDARALLASQFTAWLSELAQRVEGRLSAFCWKGRVFSLAIETDYGFAAVASNVDMRDLDAVRRSYSTSLREMGKTLDLLLENKTLFAQQT